MSLRNAGLTIIAALLICLPASALDLRCGTLDIMVDDATAQIVGARLPSFGRL